MLRLCTIALVLAAFSAPGRARAWTSAQVRDVRVEIALAPQGTAQVTLDIGVEVLGGYLSRFDLEGLDEELALVDGQAAWLTTDQGVIVPAQAVSEGGGITLRFDKRSAARRGLHRIGVRYVAPLLPQPRADDPTQVELSWVLPGWEQGLSRAEIVLRGPKGLVPVADPDQAVQVSQRVQDGQSVIDVVRVLVPRGTPWSVAVQGPAKLFSVGRPSTHALAAPARVAHRSFVTGAWLALLVLTLGFFSRRSFRARARELGVVARPWIASDRRRHALTAALIGLAGWAGTWSVPVLLTALLALVVCAVDRLEHSPGTVPLGRFVPLAAPAQSRLRSELWRQRLGRSPLADVATLAGGAGCLGVLACALALGQRDVTAGLGLLCVLPLWAASSRLRLPRSTAEQVALLLNAAKHALALSCGMRLVAFVVGEGRCSSPRLRIVPATRFSGLLRIDVAVDTRRSASALVLIAVTQADSLAERALAGALDPCARELSPRGHRVAYVQPIEELGMDLERVLSALAAHSQRAVDLAETPRAA